MDEAPSLSPLTPAKYYRGVFRFHNCRWLAKIKWHSRTLNLGEYDTPEEAARVYDYVALMLRGPDAILNFPEDQGKLPLTVPRAAVVRQLARYGVDA